MPTPAYDNLDLYKKMSLQRNEQTIKALGPPTPEVLQSEVHYPTRDGTTIRGKLYRPSQLPEGGSPLVVLFHGGGFCIGIPESEEQSCRNFVQAYGAVCLSAAYRLAPEFPFPCGVLDAWDALRWAADNCHDLGADPSLGFVVGGTSAGANMAAVLAHLARDDGISHPLTGQYLAIPPVLQPTVVPDEFKEVYLSYEQNRHAPVLPVAASEMFLNGYRPDDTDSKLWAIFNHPKGHHNLPPAVFHIDGLDPLRDEGLIYERVLRERYNVRTKLYVYPGLPHGHWAFFPSLKASTQFRKDQVEGMGWLLGKDPVSSGLSFEAKATSA